MAYSGWNVATYAAGERKRPERILPAYLGLNLVLIYFGRCGRLRSAYDDSTWHEERMVTIGPSTMRWRGRLRDLGTGAGAVGPAHANGRFTRDEDDGLR